MASEKSAEVMAKEAAEFIQKLAPGFTPKVALTLGSGCGDVANEIVPVCTVEYGKLPGFPVSSVQGHAGVLILGHLAGVPIVGLKGRVHYYEGTVAHRLAICLITHSHTPATALIYTLAHTCHTASARHADAVECDSVCRQSPVDGGACVHDEAARCGAYLHHECIWLAAARDGSWRACGAYRPHELFRRESPYRPQQ